MDDYMYMNETMIESGNMAEAGRWASLTID
jgi:hypothetical protein